MGIEGKIIVEIMNPFSFASFSRNPVIILLLQAMTFSKEAYQTLKINNERVSFSCPKGKKKKNPAERENVCESTKMFILGWAAVCFKCKEQHVCCCVSGGLLPQDSWGSVFGETLCGKHPSPSPSNTGNKCSANDRQRKL